MKHLIAYLLLFTNTVIGFCQTNHFVFDKKLSTWNTSVAFYDLQDIAFDPSDKYLAAVGHGLDNFIIWNIDSGTIFKNLTQSCLNFSPYQVGFTADGKYMVSVGTLHRHKGIKIWRTDDFSLVKELVYDTLKPYKSQNGSFLPRTVLSMYFTSDGKYLITGDDDGMIKVWDIKKWKLLFSMATNSGSIWSIDGTNDSKLLATSGTDGKVRFWQLDKGKLIFRNSFKLSSTEISSISISPDNKFISVNVIDTLKITSCETGKTEKIFLVKDSTEYATISVDFDPNGQFLATGHCLNNLKVWSLKSGDLIANLQGEINKPLQNEDGFNYVKVKFSSKGKYLAFTNDASFIYLYKIY